MWSIDVACGSPLTTWMTHYICLEKLQYPILHLLDLWQSRSDKHHIRYAIFHLWVVAHHYFILCVFMFVWLNGKWREKMRRCSWCGHGKLLRRIKFDLWLMCGLFIIYVCSRISPNSCVCNVINFTFVIYRSWLGKRPYSKNDRYRWAWAKRWQEHERAKSLSPWYIPWICVTRLFVMSASEFHLPNV